MHPSFHRTAAVLLLALTCTAGLPQRTAHATGVPLCILGENRAATNGDAYMTPGYGFFELIQPGACTQCLPGAAFRPTAVSFYGWFREVCSLSLRVTFVGAQTVAGCLQPDTSLVLCPPQILTVGAQTTNGFDLYRMALNTSTSACCLSRPAFVRMEVIRNNCSSTFKVILGTVQPCLPCQTYYTTPVPSGITDACDANTIMTGNAVLRVEGDCCAATEVHNRTWGVMKSIYR